MNLKTFVCLAFGALSCTSTSQKSKEPPSIYINDVKIECPPAGTWIDCMPISELKSKLSCRSDVKNWIIKNCKDVRYAN